MNNDVLLNELVGAKINSAHLNEGDGVHFILEDGRILIVTGSFAMALLLDKEKLH